MGATIIGLLDLQGTTSGRKSGLGKWWLGGAFHTTLFPFFQIRGRRVSLPEPVSLTEFLPLPLIVRRVLRRRRGWGNEHRLAVHFGVRRAVPTQQQVTESVQLCRVVGNVSARVRAGFRKLSGRGRPDPEPGRRVDWRRFNGSGLDQAGPLRVRRGVGKLNTGRGSARQSEDQARRSQASSSRGSVTGSLSRQKFRLIAPINGDGRWASGGGAVQEIAAMG